MAYYTAFINQWAQETGTTAQKLAAINALTVSGSIPASIYVTGSQVANCINYGEFKALTAQQQSNLLALCATPGTLLSGSSNLSLLLPGMLIDYFNVSGPTIVALTALAAAAVTPWPLTNGYSYPMTINDCNAAGLS